MLAVRLVKFSCDWQLKQPLLIILSGGFLDAVSKQQSFKVGI
jgi:hypothetical protein